MNEKVISSILRFLIYSNIFIYSIVEAIEAILEHKNLINVIYLDTRSTTDTGL